MELTCPSCALSSSSLLWRSSFSVWKSFFERSTVCSSSNRKQQNIINNSSSSSKHLDTEPSWKKHTNTDAWWLPSMVFAVFLLSSSAVSSCCLWKKMEKRQLELIAHTAAFFYLELTGQKWRRPENMQGLRMKCFPLMRLRSQAPHLTVWPSVRHYTSISLENCQNTASKGESKTNAGRSTFSPSCDCFHDDAAWSSSSYQATQLLLQSRLILLHGQKLLLFALQVHAQLADLLWTHSKHMYVC